MLDLINVSYDTLIPNNVGLSQDKRVLKALRARLRPLLSFAVHQMYPFCHPGLPLMSAAPQR